MQNWKELSRELAFQKYSRKIEKVDFEMPDGKVSDFYIKKEGTAVAVVAITKDGKVVLAKQYRPGPMEVLLELPGGGVNLEKETAEEAGLRELLEETGYSGKAELVTTVYDCAYSTMNRYCVVVRDAEKIGEQKLDETEFVETVLLDIPAFRELLRSGKMTDVEVGYLCLDHLGLL